MKKLLIFTILPLIILLTPANGQAVEIGTPIYQTLDLSTTPNSSDFLYGIDCSDPNYIYSTIFSQGSLARIAKLDGSVTIFDNNSVSSGEDWYSVVRDPTTGKLLMNEKDTGITRVFNPSSNTYTTIAIPENIAGGVISYTSSYANAPHDITISGSGVHVFGFSSFGELKATNGYVWQVINYDYDFSASEEAAGAVDVSFDGIARIDPNTNTVTRFSIAGSSALRGITIDAVDSTVLWITDISADKIFKYDTDTNTVVDTIVLTAGSKARGIVDDGTFLYVAMNEVTGSGNSKILKINKSTEATTTIDTGAAIGGTGNSGTFSVFIAGSYLVWTDESAHIGIILLSDNSIKTTYSTNGHTSSNHFGCLIGSSVYVAGHGSAVVSSISLSGSSQSHGDSCMGDCYAPHLGNDENSRHFYDDGLSVNGIVYEIKNQLHNHAEKILEFPVGVPINVTLKVQDSYPDNVKSCEIAFGIPKGHFVKQDASFILGTTRTFDGVVSTYSEGDKSAFRDFNSSMEDIGNNVIVKTVVTPTKHIKYDMFALECKDIHGYYATYFINDGILFRGMSEVGTPVFDYLDKSGKKHTLTLVDQTLEDQTLAVDEDGNYWNGDFGRFWSMEFVRPDMTGSLSHWSDYDRNDYFEFKAKKLGQELLAKTNPDYGFDSSKIQKTVKPFKTIEYPEKYPRGTHDPVPNMMKAVGEYEKSKLTNIVK